VGLEQDRVHVHGPNDARRFRLHRLSAADPAAVRHRRRIQGHVLRLERRDPKAVVGEDAADRGCQQRPADVRCGAEQHDRARSSGSVPF
jgi:hypothetical protein